jgi:hypothetical protein
MADDTFREVTAKLLLGTVADTDVATAASEQRACVEMFVCVMRDSVNPEIVLGHGMVMFAYGSETTIHGIKDVLVELTK